MTHVSDVSNLKRILQKNCVRWFEICGAKLKLNSTYPPTENADENEYAEYLEELSLTQKRSISKTTSRLLCLVILMQL